MGDDYPLGVRSRLGRGVQESLHGNATAFGYSVTITASFGAVQHERGQPSYVDLLLFGVGAVIAFAVVEAVVSGGFRVPLMHGSEQVVTLGTALAFLSVAFAITTALGAAHFLRGGVAWFAGALGGSLVFVLAESLEFMLAEWLQERRGEPTE